MQEVPVCMYIWRSATKNGPSWTAFQRHWKTTWMDRLWLPADDQW